MKRLFLAIFACLLFLLMAEVSWAGVFGDVSTSTVTNYATVGGITNSPPISTNYVFANWPAKNGVIILDIADTNEVFKGVYGMQFPTNIFWFTNVTYEFSRGTNGGTLTTNVPAVSVPLPVVFLMQANITAGDTNRIYVP